MGTYVAEYLALDHPERVLGLVLIGTFRTLAGRADLAGLAGVLEDMEETVDLGLVREFQQSTLAQAVPEAFFNTIVSESAKVPAHVWRCALQALLQIDHFDQLGRITAPSFIFWGDQDGLSTLRDQYALASALGGELRLYAGAGHSLHWEQPKRFAHDLTKLIDGIEGLNAAPARSTSQHRR